MKKIYVDEEAKFHDSDPVLGDIVVRLDDKHVHLFISERYWCWHLEDSAVMSKGTCPEWPPEKRDGDNVESEGRR